MRSALLLSALVTLVGVTGTGHAMDQGHRALGADPECCGTGCAQACTQDLVLAQATTIAPAKKATPSSEPKTIKVKAVGVKFDPLIVYAEVGDTVSFVNMPAHLVESIGEMSPPELEPFLTEMSADVALVMENEGIVTYKCTPHWGSRMGGFIVVGQPENLDELVTQYLETADTVPGLKAAKGLVKKLRKDLEKKGML